MVFILLWSYEGGGVVSNELALSADSDKGWKAQARIAALAALLDRRPEVIVCSYYNVLHCFDSLCICTFRASFIYKIQYEQGI